MSAAANSSTTGFLLQSLGPGHDSRTVSELFGRHRERLRKLIRLRLDWRMRAKSVRRRSSIACTWTFASESTNIRPAGDRLSTCGCAKSPANASSKSTPIIWAKQTADARRELHLQRGALPEVTAALMAAQLLGDRAANQSAVRANMLLMLEGALNGMDPLDREIIAMRNFEELTGDEAATVLGMTKAAATIRHLHAVKKLNEILASVPGFFPGKA